jgi:hypothetical protein
VTKKPCFLERFSSPGKMVSHHPASRPEPAAEAAHREGWFDVSTFKEPFRVEGKVDEDERIVLLITGSGLKQLL